MKTQDPGTKPSTFWDKKEGKWGKFGIVLMVAAGIIGLSKLWPFMIAFVNGAADLTIALVRAGLIIGAVGFVIFTLTRPKIRTMLAYWYKGLLSLIVNGYVRRNYVQIMNTYIEDMNERLGMIKTNIRDVGRSKGRVDNDMATSQKELDESYQRIKDIKNLLATETNPDMQQKLKMEITTITGMLGTTDEGIKMLKVESDRLDMMMKVLRKVERYSEAMITRLAHKVKNMVRNHETISQARSVFMHAREVAFGGSSARDMFDDSYEEMVKRTGADMGDIDAMMEEFKGALNAQDVNVALNEEAGKRLLAEWEHKMDAKMSENFSYLEQNVMAQEPVAVAVKSEEKGDQKASKWLQ